MTVLLVGLDALTTLAFPTVARYAVDAGITARAPDVLRTAVLLGIAIVAVGWVVVATQTVVTARAGESLLYLLRVRSYAHLQRLGLDYYERELSGRIMTRMTTDVDALLELPADRPGPGRRQPAHRRRRGRRAAGHRRRPGPGRPRRAPGPGRVDAVVPGAVVARLRRGRERVAVVNADMQENVTGVRVAQAFTRERRERDGVLRPQPGLPPLAAAAQRYIATFFPFVALLSDLGDGRRARRGGVAGRVGCADPGHPHGVPALPRPVLRPGPAALAGLRRLPAGPVGLRRIGDLLRTPTTASDDGTLEVPARLRGEVELRDVGFAYAGTDRPALSGVSLRVAPGETVALVGATGAGKSTLVKLLARFYDVGSGAVLVDGVDVRRYRLAAFRHRLGIVPQEPHLFAGDVAGNIAYGRPDATPARDRGRGAGRRGTGPRPGPAGRLPRAGGGARAGPVGGAAPARRPRPGRAGLTGRAAVRRGDGRARPRDGVGRARRGRPGDVATDRVRRRAPARHGRAVRPGRRDARRPDRRAGSARGSRGGRWPFRPVVASRRAGAARGRGERRHGPRSGGSGGEKRLILPDFGRNWRFPDRCGILGPVTPRPYADLVAHLVRSTPLSDGEADRVVAEVVAWFSEPVAEFVRRRHRELAARGLTNDRIFTVVGVELSGRLFPAPPLTTAPAAPPGRTADPEERHRMCGIVGYIGTQDAAPILLEGLGAWSTGATTRRASPWSRAAG